MKRKVTREEFDAALLYPLARQNESFMQNLDLMWLTAGGEDNCIDLDELSKSLEALLCKIRERNSR